MKPYREMTKGELEALYKSLKLEYRQMQSKDLRLDMSRGKPSLDQLDISMGLMDVLSSEADLTSDDGGDPRGQGAVGGYDGGAPGQLDYLRQLQLKCNV